MKKKIAIENPEDIPTKIIADSIISISDGIKAMRNGRLNEKAILILVAHASGCSQAVVKKVIDGLDNLKTMYTRR